MDAESLAPKRPRPFTHKRSLNSELSGSGLSPKIRFSIFAGKTPIHRREVRTQKFGFVRFFFRAWHKKGKNTQEKRIPWKEKLRKSKKKEQMIRAVPKIKFSQFPVSGLKKIQWSLCFAIYLGKKANKVLPKPNLVNPLLTSPRGGLFLR